MQWHPMPPASSRAAFDDFGFLAGPSVCLLPPENVDASHICGTLPSLPPVMDDAADSSRYELHVAHSCPRWSHGVNMRFPNLVDANRGLQFSLRGVFDPRCDQLISRQLVEEGVWDPTTSMFLMLASAQSACSRRNGNRICWMVDAGAHIGYFSVLAAHIGFRVVAIEASKRNAVLLRENVANLEDRGLLRAKAPTSHSLPDRLRSVEPVRTVWSAIGSRDDENVLFDDSLEHSANNTGGASVSTDGQGSLCGTCRSRFCVVYATRLWMPLQNTFLFTFDAVFVRHERSARRTSCSPQNRHRRIRGPCIARSTSLDRAASSSVHCYGALSLQDMPTRLQRRRNRSTHALCRLSSVRNRKSATADRT